MVEPSKGKGWIIGQYKAISAAVGDKLIFSYSKSHNVYRLATRQSSCPSDFFASGAVAKLVGAKNAGSGSGSFPNRVEVTMASSGTFYYACEVSGHCNAGMIVKVVVASKGKNASPPPPPPPVAASITLDMAIDSIKLGSAARSKFESDFRTDVAAALGVKAEQIVIKSISAGSVKVDFTVAANSNGLVIGTSKLASAFSKPGVSLGGAKSISTIASNGKSVTPSTNSQDTSPSQQVTQTTSGGFKSGPLGLSGHARGYVGLVMSMSVLVAWTVL